MVLAQKKIGVLLSYVNILLNIVSNLVYTPIMLKILGVNEYGIYTLSSSFVNYFSLLYVSLSSSYLKMYFSYKKKNDIESIYNLNGLFLLLFTILGLIVFIVIYISSNNVEYIFGDKLSVEEYDTIRILLFIMGINIAVTMPKVVFAALSISNEKFIFLKSLDIFRSIFVPVFSIIVLYHNLGSVGMSVVVLLCTIIDLCINVFYCFKFLSVKFCFSKIKLSILPTLFNFSFWIMLQSVMDQLNWQIGKLVLVNVSGSTAVAVYSVGVQLNQLFITCSCAISGVFIPQVYKIINSKNAAEKLSDLFCRIGRLQYILLFGIWTVFLLFGRAFLNLWAGPVYANAYYVGLLLMTPILIALTQNIAIEILRAYNKHAIWNLINLAVSIISFAISIPLAINFNEIGAALSTCITMGINTIIIHNIYYRKVAHLDIKKYFKMLKSLLKPSLIALVSGIMISKAVYIISWQDFAIVIMLFIISYAIITYRLALNIEERQYIRKIIWRRK